MNKMNGLDLMADYVFLSKYSQRNENDVLETWEEVNRRIYETHRIKLESLGLLNDKVEELLSRCETLENNKIILSSQRARQFAFPNMKSGILKHETRLYNCCSTYIDRTKVFSEIMYLLLCGCGVGYSLHKPFINKLPKIKKLVVDENGNKLEPKKFTIPDTSEGFSDSIDFLITNAFEGIEVEFNYNLIRSEGELIDGKFKAPGPKYLEIAHKKIKKLFGESQGRKLTSLEIHDLICFIAESVISGGIRRSALIVLFDKDDELMLNCKTGEWYIENPQRAMANNSILTTYDDSMTYSELKTSMKTVQQFGEPGFLVMPDYWYVCNPCGEILMKPRYGRTSGFAFCNLVEINADIIKDEETFYEACELSSFIGTVQSLYTDFKYLSDISRKIAERDRNIGVSITSVMSNPMMRDKDILTKGAQIVAQTNKTVASMLEIHPSRTCTTIKPSGNASTILGLTCSGIHPTHAEKYLRRIRIKNNSPEFKALQNTPLVKVLSNNESIISFPIDTTNNTDNIIYKDGLTAVEHLDIIKTVKHFWINKGSLTKTINHNISATIEVNEGGEWDEVAAVLYTNKYLLTGVSLLPKCGDQLYTYAPFTRLYNKDIIDEYNEIENYINSNEVDFNAIMSNRDEFISGDMTAMGCSGGMCELR